MYHISHFCPRGGMGGHGFFIHLSPQFKQAVDASDITQEKIDHLIKVEGQGWLQHCGFSSYFDIERSITPYRVIGHQNVELAAMPSPKARPLYDARSTILITWGEWGIEYMSVPGNCCCLGLGRHGDFSYFNDGRVLTPHNIDSWNQKILMTTIFSRVADVLVLALR